MSLRPMLVLLTLLVLCLATSYGLRYALLEDARWLAVCAEQSLRWECRLRSLLGLLIHFRLLAWLSLALAVPGFVLRGRSGRGLAALALLLGAPALVLYSASLAVFAVVLAALRLVRAEPERPAHSAQRIIGR